MKTDWSRRKFGQAAVGWVGALLSCRTGLAAARRLKIGHTGITWGFRPEDAERAIRDVGSLGYHGYETFGNVLEAWEPKGGLGRLLDAAGLPLVSAYCPVNLTDASRRKEEVATIVRWGRLIRKYGGTVAVIGPNGVKRAAFDFNAAKPAIVAALNDMAMALADIGVVGALHQHTGTCIEFRDEVYAVMEAADTRYVKFGPDVGQLQKGGSDPVKIVSDFLSLIEHVHLKDWDGGPHYEGYCPLGRGKVDIPRVLDLLEKSKIKAMIMVELDPSKGMPLEPIETARISKEYLKGLGYQFKS
jgi:inosose dehydratase